jgi:ketosteroid isomerase-like protein
MAKKRPTKKSRPAAKKSPAAARKKVASPTRKQAASARAQTRPNKPAAPERHVVKRARPTPVVNPVRQLAQRIVDLTLAGDDEGSLAFYAGNVESVEPGMPPAVGLDAIKRKFAMWRSMIRDAAWEARNLWADGNTILIEWVGHVTFQAGHEADMHEIAVHEVQNGKIVRERFFYDRAALQPPQPASQPSAQPPANV